MLEVIFYHKNEDLVTWQEAQGEDLPLIVCPNPEVADGLRNFLSKKIEIITISRWVSNHLKDQKLKRTNKSELILRLSSVWRHYFQDADASLFFNSFELFTELRSFSLSLDLLSEFLKEVEEDISKSILLFWAYLQNENIIDEQLSYQLLPGSLGDGYIPLWFVGFKHLGGVQVDMLKTMGEKIRVKIFFPENVYYESLNTDWIRWLVPEKEMLAPAPKRKVKVISYPKNKLNITLNVLKNKLPKFDLALASLGSSFNARQEIYSNGLFLKSPEDIFLLKRLELFDEFEFASMSVFDFLKLIESRKQLALKKEDFITYKLLLLLSEALGLYGEMQENIDRFALKVLEMVLELNSPRVFFTTLLPSVESRLLEMSESATNISGRPLILVASLNYGSLKMNEGINNEKLIKSLSAIAPIKRSGLDFSFLKNEIVEILSQDKNILLMEEGLDLVDLSWREILNNFECEVVLAENKFILKKTEDYLLPLIKPGPYLNNSISASRLQSFFDCPRKYYFSYIEKINYRPEERMALAADELGVIEHEVIKSYFHQKEIKMDLAYDQSAHYNLCHVILEKFLVETKMPLDEMSKITSFYEILNHSKNGIDYLIKFCNDNLAFKVEFEKKLSENIWGLVGAIDCVVYFKNNDQENNLAVFDFKRSASAVGSRRESLSFQKIQIWVYLLVLWKYQNEKIRYWGYLNLSETEASVVFDQEKEVVLNESLMVAVEKKITDLIEEINMEVSFFARPQKEKVCSYCQVQLFCNKGEMR